MKNFWKNCTIKDKISYILVGLVLVLVVVANVQSHIIEEHNEANLQKQVDTLTSRIDNITIAVEDLHALIGKYYLDKSKSEKLCDANVAALIYSCRAYYPDIIMAQYKLESGRGTSNVYKRTNNLFGMKKTFYRETCRNASKDNNGYAEYHNWQLSVIDRVLWDVDRFNTKPTRDEYLAVLAKVYAEDPHYVDKIENICSQEVI